MKIVKVGGDNEDDIITAKSNSAISSLLAVSGLVAPVITSVQREMDISESLQSCFT